MRRGVARTVIGLALVASSACGDGTVVPAAQSIESLPAPPGSDQRATSTDYEETYAGSGLISRWRFVSLEVGGEFVSVDRLLFLDITDDGFRAATTCNWVDGQFGGELMRTAMACGGSANTTENFMVQAFEVEPVGDGDRLVFDDGDVRLVYEAFTDPTPAELFAILDDADVRVDESALPPEQATGSVPPDYEILVPLPSPSDEVDLFLGVLGKSVCIVHGTATTVDADCALPREAAEFGSVAGIPKYVEPIIRVALIPDRFAAAAAARSDLGTYDSNVLTIRADAPEGKHALVDGNGEQFVLYVPSPWFDPSAASRTDPPGDG